MWCVSDSLKVGSLFESQGARTKLIAERDSKKNPPPLATALVPRAFGKGSQGVPACPV